MAKYLHLTLEQRIEIQECLGKGMSFKAIGRRLGKDQTTISKEVKKHITAGADGKQCLNLTKAPFVCNACKRVNCYCGYAKRRYYAHKADASYHKQLIEAREGVALNKEQFWENNRIVSDGIKKGQHLYHIIKSHNLKVSESTVYRHSKRGYLDVDRIAFPRLVKFKPRHAKMVEYVPKKLKIGRTYNDFREYCDKNNITHWVEMDTVIGAIGGKVILTFDFTFCNFMFGILLENKAAVTVSKSIIALQQQVDFSNVFPVILTDNGGEFSDVFTFESSGSKLFFCDPLQSCQKPHVEKNHTLFRDIVPSGDSFNDFNQETVNKIFSHVNGVRRKSLGGKSAYEVFTFTYGQELAAKLGITFVESTEVIQSKRLLKD